MTLLEMVQDILSSMDSDEVNSVSDTAEAEQVALILKNTYNNLVATRVIPERFQLTTLVSSSDVTKPTTMTLATGVGSIDWIKYNSRTATDTQDRYNMVKFITPEEFVQRSTGLNSSASNVEKIKTDGGATLYIRNDVAPTYWTTFDNEILVFDSYNKQVDSVLQESKSLAYVSKDEVFDSGDDSFVPDLNSRTFPLLLEEARSVAFAVLKQSVNAKTEQLSKRNHTALSRNKYISREQNSAVSVNYGRK